MFRPLTVFARGAVVLAMLFMTFPSGGFAEEEVSLTVAKSCEKLSERIVKRLRVPKYYHEGLYYDGKSIWLCNGEGGKIWLVDTSSGNVISEIDPVACFTETITARGDGTYYTTEWDEKKVYRVGLEGDKLAVKSCVSVAPHHPAGAVWNGNRLYVILWDRGLTGTKFSVAEMDADMKVVRRVRIRSIQEPCQLAWDGARLWMTSWYDRRVYKIDVDAWRVLGYFCSPVERTTGVAWDGKYIWLTGTYADLYQMEIAGAAGPSL